jgi:predicted Rossmann-fold nucleotide-binding protein
MSYILIIAGGRDYHFTDADKLALSDHISGLIYHRGAVTVRTGGAGGADTEGHRWAMYMRYQMEVANLFIEPPMTAQWKDLTAPGAVVKQGHYGLYNARAGHDRNRRMAYGDGTHRKANGVVLFPGGNGTDDMYKIAEEARLDVFDWRESDSCG